MIVNSFTMKMKTEFTKYMGADEQKKWFQRFMIRYLKTYRNGDIDTWGNSIL